MEAIRRAGISGAGKEPEIPYQVWCYGSGMAAVKVTFTLDAETVKRIAAASERLSVPKSQVVREAVQDYYERLGKMSERERARMLRIFDEVIPAIPARPLNELRRELNEIRLARRQGGRAAQVGRRK